MKTVLKFAVAVTLTGALVLAAATPSEARHGRNAALIGGLAAGVLIGAAIANSANNSYYGAPGYYYAEPGYAYAPGYAYGPAYRYRGRPRGTVINGRAEPSCATDGGYGRIDYGAC